MKSRLGVFLLALLFIAPASARVLRGSSPISFPAIFQGNINSTISSIGGSITASRTSCVTPCFVQVSASGITASGTRLQGVNTASAAPYEDLEYQWNFGNPAGVETFTTPTTGSVVNINSSQVGPEAVYVYRSAGTYPVTLTVRGKNGSGYTTAQFTQNITVTAFAPSTSVSCLSGTPTTCEFWVDPNATGTGTGLSPTNAFTSLAPLQTAAGKIANYPGTGGASGSMAVHLANGSVFTGTGGLILPNNNVSSGPASNFRLDSYTGTVPSGAKPIVEVTSNTAAFDTGNSGPPGVKQDIVASGIVFRQSATGTASAIVKAQLLGAATATASDFYIDNCDVIGLSNAAAGLQSTVINGAAAVTSGSYQRTGVYGGSTTRLIWNALTVTGAINSPTTPGLIQITTSVPHQMITGQAGVVVASVGGVPAANGTWTITSTGASTFDLQGSTFAGAYTSGGTANATINSKDLVFGGAEKWHFIFGNTLTGSGQDAARSHYIYPDQQEHSLFAMNSFGATGTVGTNSQFSYNVNINWDQAPCCTTAFAVNYVNIRDNASSGGQYFHDAGDNSNDATETTFQNFVTERNWAGTTNGFMFSCCLASYTSRFNRYWSGTGAVGAGFLAGYKGTPGIANWSIYSNKIYIGSGIGTGNYGVTLWQNADTITFSGGAGSPLVSMSSNFITIGSPVRLGGAGLDTAFTAGTTYYVVGRPTPGTTLTLSATPGGSAINAIGNGTGTQTLAAIWSATPQTITDNIIQDDRPANSNTPQVALAIWPDQQAATSLWDRNIYYGVNATTSSVAIFEDDFVHKTFAQWQAVSAPTYFDPNGSVTNPSWTTPVTQGSDMGP